VNTALQFGLVALGGAVGASLRYAVNLGVVLAGRVDFPYATLAVNAAGSLLAGLLLVLFTTAWPHHPGWRVFAMTGLLGGFTTFSAFSVETLALFQAGQLRAAALNILTNVVLCLALCGAGIALARRAVA